jgi:DNA/RNA endonuclease YhcR with UshA esterase domain
MTRLLTRSCLGLVFLAAASCESATAPAGTPSTVEVRVYVDVDGSGTFSPGDVPLGGVPVTLRDAGGGTVSATTGADGRVVFEGVAPGSYTASIPAGSLPPGTTIAGAREPVVLAPFQGAAATTEIRLVPFPGTIAGRVYRDDSGDGTFQPEADTPAAGLEVRLHAGSDTSGEPMMTTETDGEGWFEFTGVRPGSYTVELVPFPTIEIEGGVTRQVSLAFQGSELLEVRFTGSLTISIAEARELPNGTAVAVEGVVTVPQGSHRNDNIYLQDATSGIQVFGIPTGMGLQIGDSVRISGSMGAFNDERQIVQPQVVQLGTGTVPAPRPVTGQQIVDHAFPGVLQVTRAAEVVTVPGGTGTAYNVTMRAADGVEFVLRVEGLTGITRAHFQVGQRYDVTGVHGDFRGTAQFKPRFPADIQPAITISEARALPLGTPVRVVGVVTVPQGSHRNDNIYLQDATSGIQVFGIPTGMGLAVGDSVWVSGSMGAFNNELQIVQPQVVRLGDGTVPAPREVTGQQIVDHAFPGELQVTRSAEVVSVPGGTGAAYTVIMRAADGVQFELRVEGLTGITRAHFQVGQRYDVTGVHGEFRGTAQFKPRSTADVVAQ